MLVRFHVALSLCLRFFYHIMVVVLMAHPLSLRLFFPDDILDKVVGKKVA